MGILDICLILWDKAGPDFSVAWVPRGHGNLGSEFQKCNYILFSTQYKIR